MYKWLHTCETSWNFLLLQWVYEQIIFYLVDIKTTETFNKLRANIWNIWHMSLYLSCVLVLRKWNKGRISRDRDNKINYERQVIMKRKDKIGGCSLSNNACVWGKLVQCSPPGKWFSSSNDSLCIYTHLTFSVTFMISRQQNSIKTMTKRKNLQPK